MRIKQFMLILAIIGSILSAAFVVPTTVHAQRHATNDVTCWGDWCSGKNPRDTHCADDAITIKQVDIVAVNLSNIPVNRGKLELRWSPTCKTKWARLSLTTTTNIGYVVATQDSGYEQKWHTGGNDPWSSTGPGVFYTNMIYSPKLRVYAHLTGAECNECATDWA